MAPRVGIIIFARMASSRFPGKMMRRIGPTTLVERVVARARVLDVPVVLATSMEHTDDILATTAAGLRVPVYRGSEQDVLARAEQAARAAGFDAFARLCGDRPFFPLDDLRRGLTMMDDALRNGTRCDLVSSSSPDPVPPGLVTEVIRTEALTVARGRGPSAVAREHVTMSLYDDPATYAVRTLPSALRQLGPVHMAVDTESDLRRLATIIEAHPDIDLPSECAVAFMESMYSAPTASFHPVTE